MFPHGVSNLSDEEEFYDEEEDEESSDEEMEERLSQIMSGSRTRKDGEQSKGKTTNGKKTNRDEDEEAMSEMIRKMIP